MRDAFGFRTAAGYGFVWSMGTDSSAPGPNLFSLSVNPNFEGGEPRPLPAENSAHDLNVVPALDGFVASTCSEASEPEWIRLNSNLDVAGGANLVAPEASCAYRAPRILWTGEGYLTSLFDARGLVVALLDERGVVVRQEVLTDQGDERAMTRFSKHGDRVLFVFSKDSLDQAWYVVLDLRGRLVGELRPLGQMDSSPMDIAIRASRDGWMVVDSVERGVRLTAISGDELVWQEQLPFAGGYYAFDGFIPSAHGGFLLVGWMDDGGQFGTQHNLIALLDDTGGVVYSKDTQIDDAESWPLAVIHDPLRDLVVESSLLEGSENVVTVQEYGCLD